MVSSWLYLPGLLEREPAVLGQADSLRALPGPAQVARAVNGRAVDEVVRGCVEHAVAGIAHGVEDFPTGQVRSVDRPRTPVLAAGDHEQPLAGTDQGGNSHRRTSLSNRRRSWRRNRSHN